MWIKGLCLKTTLNLKTLHHKDMIEHKNKKSKFNWNVNSIVLKLKQDKTNRLKKILKLW